MTKQATAVTPLLLRAARAGLVVAVAGGAAGAATAISTVSDPENTPFEQVERAYADDTAGSSFTEGAFTYQVTTAAAEGSQATVQLTTLDTAQEGAVEIPEEVTSSATGITYKVTRLQFGAFLNCKNVTSIYIPASIESYQFINNARLTQNINACFIGCSSLESITVAQDNPVMTADDGVLYAKDSAGNKAAVMAFPQNKTDVTEFTVPETVHTVVGWAFANNTTLKTVNFQAGLLGDAFAYPNAGSAESSYMGGIGGAAFKACTALEAVNFPQDAQLGTCVTNASAPALGNYAFQDCTALTKLTIPAITTADRKGNAYHSFATLNPNSNYTLGADSFFISGFASYWHNNDGPVERVGVGNGAFSGCTALETLVLKAGNSNGAYAYWSGSNNTFASCSNLKSIIFEGQQAYWGNPQTSMTNGKYTDIWLDSDENTIATPTYYLAVDYYATQENAQADDAEGSARLARVEYARGTSVAEISSSAASLSEAMAPRDLYATSDADGVVPNAQEAAQAAGLGQGDWVWALSDTQQHRTTLTESCKAYLVNKADLSAGRLDAKQVSALYLACDRNLSEGTVAGTAFDPARYAGGSIYHITALSGEDTPFFSYNRTTETLMADYTVCAADGTQLSKDAYTVSYQTYNAETKQLEDTQVTGEGAYLVNITPTAESGYTGVLQDWIVVKLLDGTASERYGSSPADTARAAHYPYSQITALDFSDAPFAVSVSANDVVGALVASSYAGLVQGAINVSSDDSSTYGFRINTSTYPSGEVNNENLGITFARATTSSTSTTETLPSVYANACFKAFENRRSSLGATTSAYPWGSTAVLVPASYASKLSSASAWAYANKASVFFTEVDGSVSSDTLANLQKFKNVKVMGSSADFSEDAYNALAASLGQEVQLSRLQGESDTSGAFSLAVAEDLVATGKASWENVSISDGENPLDAIVALTYTGHEKGVTLQVKSTSDAKRLAELLHQNNAEVAMLALYGRPENNATQLTSSATEANAFMSLWVDDDTFKAAMGAVTAQVDKYPDTANTYETSNGGEGANDGQAAQGAEAGATPNALFNDGPSQSRTVTKTTSKVVQRFMPGTTSRTAGATNSGGSKASSTAKTGGSKAASGAGSGSGSGSDAGAAASNEDSSEQPRSLAEASANLTPLSSNDASADSDEQANNELYSNIPDTPLGTRAAFVSTLLALCGSIVPILRRCK